MKLCKRCNTEREFKDFRKAPQNKDGLQSYCKFCQNKLKTEWSIKNREKVREYAAKVYREDPRKAKGKAIQKFFKGLSWQQAMEVFEEMLKVQEYSCKICKVHQSKKVLHVDHCHSRGVVRGLLCAECNITLGRIKESIPTLESMIKFIQDLKNIEVPVYTRRLILNAPKKPKTHCPQGHELSGDNLIMRKNIRRCRICKNEQERAREKRNKEKLLQLS